MIWNFISWLFHCKDVSKTEETSPASTDFGSKVTTQPGGNKVLATPAVRHMAKEKNVYLSGVQASVFLRNFD